MQRRRKRRKFFGEGIYITHIFDTRWNHLWLNEGFASYFEYIGAEAVYDKDFVWQMYFYKNLGDALNRDILPRLKMNATVPESKTTQTNDEIESLFGWRIYQRGACMIHMLRSMLHQEERKLAPSSPL